jgi:signal peptidase II
MPAARKVRIVVLLLILGCTVGCDQTTKHIARMNLGSVDSIAVFNGFGELRLAENPGAFLSFGAALPPTVRTIVFTLAVGAGLVWLLAYLWSRHRLNWIPFAGLAFLTAGGMSNFIDRVTREGLVTDFITLRLGPLRTGIFNLADVVVMTGMGILAFALWKERRPATDAASNIPKP